MITNRYAGDNYRVRATGRKPTDATKPFDLQPTTWGGIYKTSGLLVAWRRIYLEIDQMYQKGATLLDIFTADANNEPDELHVDNTSDFTIGDKVVIWHRGDYEIESEIVSKTDTAIKVKDIPRNLHNFAGIRLKDSTETFGEVSRGFLVKAYGEAADGSDGGTFVEFKEIEGWIVPKWHILPSAGPFNRTQVNFCLRWFKHNNTDQNFFQLLTSRRGGNFGGVAYPPHNTATVCMHEANAIWGATIAAHEIGHNLDLVNPDEPGNHGDGVIAHADKEVNARNHDNSDECFMTYNENRYDENVELDLECLYHVRDFKEPY